LQSSPFAKELYKQVRNKAKRLDDIAKIEERQQTGVKINEE
jgi:hypothetical protein